MSTGQMGSLGDIFVMLSDWRGRCIWTSEAKVPMKVGELVWAHLTKESQQEAKLALGQVVALRETKQLEVADRLDGHFRGLLMPLDNPEVAVCMLGMHIPSNLESLTARERGCLELLGQGIETGRIAIKLDISVSTIHTHLKHAREKLGLRSLEALISFAARYFYPVASC